MKAEKISIESPLFQQMKNAFDSKLNGLINKMLAKGREAECLGYKERGICEW